MDKKNTIIGVVAVVIVLAIIGWASGWFSSQAPQDATAPATTTEQPAAPATTTEQPAAPAPATPPATTPPATTTQ
jgi:flagellar basal body-associated protein FliL